jgi:hypothetical protein
MRKYVVVLVLCVWLGPAWAADLREIELRDGTVLRGEIVSLQNGTYTIRSRSLGDVKIAASDVEVIRFPSGRTGPSAAGEGDPTPAGAGEAQGELEPSNNLGKQDEALGRSDDAKRQVEQVQRSLTADDSIMQTIKSLQNDPEVQAVLNDPQVMQAVETDDLAALMANPKFLDLLRNPKVQEIQRRAGMNQ